MKSHRINFERGINVIGDKALLPDGFGTILDNVDLRSGFPRPFKKPEYQFAVDNATTCSWSYRGQWFHSASHREYAGEYIGGIQRVYQFEDGKYPKKVIGGVTVPLGAIKPKAMLSIAESSSLVPGGFAASPQYSGKGNITDGKRVYRICATTDDGTMPPTAPVSVNISDTNHAGASVELTWGSIPKAKSYIIFQGTDSEQYKLTEVPATQLSYTDTGAVSAAGDIASQYLQTQSFAYAYSYVRTVNGVTNESGLSYPSISSTGSQGRVVTRDPLNDGYAKVKGVDENGNDIDLWSTATGTWISNPASKSLSGVVVSYDEILQQTAFVVTSHGLTTGDKLKFTMSDATWSGQIFEIVVINASTFAVANRNIPSDATVSNGVYHMPSGTSYRAQKTTIDYTSTASISTGDALYVNSQYFCKATKVDSNTITIPIFLANAPITIKWLPKNGYYTKWNVYRNEQGGWFLVDSVDIWDVEYQDAKPFSALTGPPSSYYDDSGIIVDFDVAPSNLRSPVVHYGMLFGIYGNNIRWTPVLQPDAWPDVFSVTLPYQPVKIESFAQGLIILCQDAIYRLDGNSPTGMSLSKTQAEDGCFAPHSVQKTDKGLLYLGKRGVMLFNGTHAECLTDTRMKPETIAGPSTINPSYPFWWMPTLMTRNYADLAGEDVIKATDYKFNLDNTNVIDGYNDHIRSMYWNGRYFLFYTGNDYAANTTLMIDLQLPGMPITTLGLKVLDAHVDEYEQPFILVANSDTDDSTAWNKFVGANSLLSTTPQTGKTGRAVHKFGASKSDRVPMHIRTGQHALGSPTERKRLRQIEFHGKGTVYCRVYVDGQWVIDATATMIEGPSKDRRIGIPIGTRGYYVDIEFCGDADIRALEFSFDGMSATS